MNMIRAKRPRLNPPTEDPPPHHLVQSVTSIHVTLQQLKTKKGRVSITKNFYDKCYSVARLTQKYEGLNSKMQVILEEVEDLFKNSEVACPFCLCSMKSSSYPAHLKTEKHMNNKKRIQMLKLLENGPQGTNPPILHPHPPIRIIDQELLPDEDHDMNLNPEIDETLDPLPEAMNLEDDSLNSNLQRDGADEPNFPEDGDLNLGPHDYDELWANAFPIPPNNNPEPQNIERQRAPGGGRPGKNYDTVAARLLASFFYQNKGKTFSEAMMQQILNMLKTTHIKPEEVPETVYHLKKSGKLFIPKREPTKLVLSTGDVYYYPPEVVVSEILKSPNDTLDWKYKHDPKDKRHPCSSKGWLVYEEAHKN